MARPTILAVDDDPRITRLIEANLETEDVEIVIASSGAECLRLLEQGGQDLLLLDVELPDCSGWDILAALRAAGAPRNLPVVVISVEPPDEATIRRYGVNGYLRKPFDVREMLGYARTLLAARERAPA